METLESLSMNSSSAAEERAAKAEMAPAQDRAANSLLTDKEWNVLRRHIPTRKRPWRKRQRKGGKPAAGDRQCFEASIWLMAHDAPLRALPPGLGSRSTTQRRLEQWCLRAILWRLWRDYLEMRPEARLPAPTRGGFWRSEVEGVARAAGAVSG